MSAAPSPSPTAAHRFVLVPLTNRPPPATVGYATVCPLAPLPPAPAIQVWRTNGQAVGSRLLWADEGEPLKVLFDSSSGDSAYLLALDGTADTNTPAWTPDAGLILETRKQGDGPLLTWEDVRDLWNRSAPVLGRSLVSHVYHGLHPHGPPRNLVARYDGRIAIAAEGDYAFAVLSSGPAFLLIDGTVVAQWPGRHNAWDGVRAEHRGTAHLTAGRHTFQYYQAHDNGEWIAAAAWQSPHQERFSILPATAFPGAGSFRVAAVLAAGKTPPPLAFEWEIVAHALTEGQALIEVRFRVLPTEGRPPARSWRWQFDDGGSAVGATATHVFCRSGLRTITLSEAPGDAQARTHTQTIQVHPLWTQRDEWPEATVARFKTELAERDLDALPLDDLTALTRLALALDDRAWLTPLGAAAYARRQELAPERVDLLYPLAFHFQHPAVRDYDMAERLWRAIPALNPQNPALTARARLRLADNLIHIRARADDALEILSNLELHLLTGDEPRLKQLLEGDAFLTQGRVDKARLLYIAAGTRNEAEGSSTVRTIRRLSAVEKARDLVRRKEWDEAADLLRVIEWNAPLERLSAETGGLMIDVHLARREYWPALARCRRLLLVPDPRGHDHADLLYRLIAIHQALGDAAEAERALAKLLTDFPYAEAAARARDRWGAAAP